VSSAGSRSSSRRTPLVRLREWGTDEVLPDPTGPGFRTSGGLRVSGQLTALGEEVRRGHSSVGNLTSPKRDSPELLGVSAGTQSGTGWGSPGAPRYVQPRGWPSTRINGWTQPDGNVPTGILTSSSGRGSPLPTRQGPKFHSILKAVLSSGDGGTADAAVLKTAGKTSRAGSSPAPRTTSGCGNRPLSSCSCRRCRLPGEWCRSGVRKCVRRPAPPASTKTPRSLRLNPARRVC
jgi:hypothetical protein